MNQIKRVLKSNIVFVCMKIVVLVILLPNVGFAFVNDKIDKSVAENASNLKEIKDSEVKYKPLNNFVKGNILHHTVTRSLDFVIAPDGSEVRVLGCIPHIVSSIEATFASEVVSKAIYHKTIAEVWYTLEGEGWFWRRDRSNNSESCIKVIKGTVLTIPKETEFQIRATGKGPLKFFIATTPHWPGAEEAVLVPG